MSVGGTAQRGSSDWQAPSALGTGLGVTESNMPALPSRLVVPKSRLSAGQKAGSQSLILKSIPHCGLEQHRKAGRGKLWFCIGIKKAAREILWALFAMHVTGGYV